MVPADFPSIRRRPVAAWHGQNLCQILISLGHDVDIPWLDLPKKTRDRILFTDEQPTVPVYAGFDAAQVRAALKRKLPPVTTAGSRARELPAAPGGA